MNEKQFDKVWLSLTDNQKNIMMEMLKKKELSEEDYKALAIHLSLVEVFNDRNKYDKVKYVVEENVRKDLFGE